MQGIDDAVDLAPFLRSAMDALGTLDATTLERLLEQAEILQAELSNQKITDMSDVAVMQRAFGDLLGITSRSLNTLQRLYAPREDAWVR